MLLHLFKLYKFEMYAMNLKMSSKLNSLPLLHCFM